MSLKSPRIEVGKIRREQIVEAAVAIIAERGLQNLSLSAIEERTGMSRGQLTYYFAAKEDILLAVFDRLLLLMHQRSRGEGNGNPCQFAGVGWDRLRHFLTVFLLNPPPAAEFHSLQYTFLSQIGHREDFRQRLASLYAEWREHLAGDVGPELSCRGKPVSPKTFATLVQAILHGLAMQRAADPDAYDRQEMLDLCLDMLEGYLTRSAGRMPRRKASRNGGHSVTNGHTQRRRGAKPANPQR